MNKDQLLDWFANHSGWPRSAFRNDRNFVEFLNKYYAKFNSEAFVGLDGVDEVKQNLEKLNELVK